jgi:hypothetical protein
MGLLDTVGQVRFTNSEQIQAQFQGERPDLQGRPLFTSMLSPGLAPSEPIIFYVAEPHQTDAGRQATALLSGRVSDALPLVIADPREASAQTLPWYVQQVYAAEAVVIHLASRRRHGAVVHNARASMIAGLARGLKRPILMLAEDDHVSALDYRELLYRYSAAQDCATRLGYWLERELAPAQHRQAGARDHATALRLSTELGSVNLGEYVAENEASGLSRYFVETSSYQSVLSGASRVYVGSKGSGKSATALQSHMAVRQDKRDLACLIKPAGYDMDGIVRLLASYEERDEKGYVAESLWKYLLTTELALAVEDDLASRPAGVMPESPEWALMRYLAENKDWIKGDFATRLERAVDSLESAPRHRKIADQRGAVSEALHAGPIRSLRALLAPALAGRRKVFILVDNLDKAWDSRGDIPQLSRLIIGLLGSMDAFRRELQKAAVGSELDVSLSLFVRSDIFVAVAALAREPDKLPVRRIRWEDEVMLLDVVERRYAASREKDAAPGDLWTRFFCATVANRPVRDWLTWVCLPRPRDILFLCHAAVDQAVARRHSKVTQEDLLAAQRQYSLFAFESAGVECQLRVDRIDDVLLEFAGASTTLSVPQLNDVLHAAGVELDSYPDVIDALRDVSFLGVKTGDTMTMFTDTPREKQRADILALRWAATQSSRRDDLATTPEPTYQVHPAFWAYLEMEAADRTPTLGL